MESAVKETSVTSVQSNGSSGLPFKPRAQHLNIEARVEVANESPSAGTQCPPTKLEDEPRRFRSQPIQDIGKVPWYFEKRKESLQFFAERGHRQIIAGYYDGKPEQIRDWLKAASPFPGVMGVMYTTWQHKYGDLEPFAQMANQ